MEPILRSAQVLKQEAEDIGFEGKDIVEYVKEQHKLDREERAAWREDRKRADQAEEKKRADEIRFAQIETAKEQAKIEAEKELALKELELKAQQSQASTSLAATPPPRNKDAKSPKLPSFIDEKDELDSYLLRFERYAENASWEKDTWAIKLLTGRAMDVYARMSDADASDYDKLKKALLTRYNYTEDGYRKRFREATPETEETPDQFVIRLKNYLAKWLELSGSSPQNFDALVDLIVKEQFISACSEDLAMYLLERGPKDLVELTTWAQKYLIAHKEQLSKSKATVQPRRVDQKKTTQSKPDSSQGRQRSLQCYRCHGFGHRQSECGTKISPGKDQKGSSTPVSQRVMCVSSPVYPVIIGNVRGAQRMLPDPDWKAEDQPGVRARTSGGNKDKDNDDNQGGDIPAWMFRRSNQKTEKSALKERDSKKKPAQPKEIDDRSRLNMKVKEGATEEKCVAGPVL